MDQIDLTDASLEIDRGGVRADEVAEEAGMDRERVRQALSSLTGDKDLLRQLPPGDPDLGPHYRVKDSAASA
jgi:hypothetical protein